MVGFIVIPPELNQDQLSPWLGVLFFFIFGPLVGKLGCPNCFYSF